MVVLFEQLLKWISWEHDEKLTKHVLAIWKTRLKASGYAQLESDHNGLDEILPSREAMYQEMNKSSGHQANRLKSLVPPDCCTGYMS